MGIDIYLRWQGMTEEERAAQQTGFSVVHGHVGYLREAYHGEPYATRVLVPEAFDPMLAGLGLYLVRTFVARMGGTIAVDTVEGMGSTFTVSMPLAEDDGLAAA